MVLGDVGERRHGRTQGVQLPDVLLVQGMQVIVAQDLVGVLWWGLHHLDVLLLHALVEVPRVVGVRRLRRLVCGSMHVQIHGIVLTCRNIGHAGGRSSRGRGRCCKQSLWCPRTRRAPQSLWRRWTRRAHQRLWRHRTRRDHRSKTARPACLCGSGRRGSPRSNTGPHARLCGTGRRGSSTRHRRGCRAERSTHRRKGWPCLGALLGSLAGVPTGCVQCLRRCCQVLTSSRSVVVSSVHLIDLQVLPLPTHEDHWGGERGLELQRRLWGRRGRRTWWGCPL